MMKLKITLLLLNDGDEIVCICDLDYCFLQVSIVSL